MGTNFDKGSVWVGLTLPAWVSTFELIHNNKIELHSHNVYMGLTLSLGKGREMIIFVSLLITFEMSRFFRLLERAVAKTA